MSVRRWIVLCLAILASLALGTTLAFAPFIRHQAQSRAERLGLSLEVQSVRPSLFGVRLSHVQVSIPEIPSLSLHIHSIAVDSSSISIEGGSATIQGDYETFSNQLQQWRAKRSSANPAQPSGNQTNASLQGLALSWPDVAGPGSSLTLEDLRVEDIFGSRAVFAGSLELRHPRATIDGEALSLAFTHGSPTQIVSLQGRRFRADLRLDPASEISPPKSTLPLTPPVASSSQKPSPTPPLQEPKPNPGATSPPLRDQIARAAAMIWAPMTPDAKVKIDAFEVQVHQGAETINIGPGILAAQQKDELLLVDLAPRVETGKQGITFRGSVPLGAGPVIFDVVGGPISLETLGVRDGNLGLIRVKDASLTVDAHLKLHADGKNLSFDGSFRAKNVSVEHRRLAPSPVLGLELAAKLDGQAALDGSLIRLDEAEIEVGKVQFQLRGTLDRRQPKMRVDVHFGIPLVACQGFLDALPPSLIPVVHGMAAAGTLSLSGHLRYDEANAKDFALEYAASNDCRITTVPKEVDVRKFTSPFKLRAYDAKGNVVEIESGPGTPGWVGSGGINPFMEAAVMTCEDGRFRRHRGFDHEAIRNSVRENLQARKFLRGASTISMQLAKNLYLSRDKTISRKLQELILTSYLEQALTKDQIMELYLNVIEFAPMTYGLGSASARYFNKHPASLSLGQAMYLASILPNPRQQHFVQGGRVSDGWMRYLYKLMRIAAKMRWISEADLEYGLGEWVVQGSPDPVRVDPEPTEGAEPKSGDEAVESDEPFGWKRGDAPAY